MPGSKDVPKPASEDARILFRASQWFRDGHFFLAGRQLRGGRQVHSNQPSDSWKEWKDLRHYLLVNLGSTWVHEFCCKRSLDSKFYPERFDLSSVTGSHEPLTP
jgi:hypothetical protein